MINKKIIFRRYFLFFFRLDYEAEIIDKCRVWFKDKYLVKWWSEETGRHFFELIRPGQIIKIFDT
jgi:hypothetical protein